MGTPFRFRLEACADSFRLESGQGLIRLDASQDGLFGLMHRIGYCADVDAPAIELSVHFRRDERLNPRWIFVRGVFRDWMSFGPQTSLIEFPASSNGIAQGFVCRTA
jgi:hypothetical protein